MKMHGRSYKIWNYFSGCLMNYTARNIATLEVVTMLTKNAVIVFWNITLSNLAHNFKLHCVAFQKTIAITLEGI
jgi:hypothetical protein